MMCPRCGLDKVKYKQRREDFTKTQKNRFKRTDFTIICKNCGEFDEHDTG